MENSMSCHTLPTLEAVVDASTNSSSSWTDLLSPALVPPHVWLYMAVGLLLAMLAALLYHLVTAPLNIVKDYKDIGWWYLQDDAPSWLDYIVWLPLRLIRPSGPRSSNRRLTEHTRRLQKLRKAGDLPPVYPNGWFAVADSRELQCGQVISVEALGQWLAVYRTHGGKVRAVDAFCPHLGANMAVGGVVKGDCLECPFHGWQFRGSDGLCTTIPYAKKVPDVARVRHWPIQEANGVVFLWHDAEGREPSWTVPVVAEVAEGRWLYRGRTQHTVLAHIQEIPENGADIAHLGHIHSPSVFKGSDLTKAFQHSVVMDVARHEWKGAWTPKEAPDAHCASVSISHALLLLSGRLRLFAMDIKATQVGPGLVLLRLDTTFGPGVLVQTVTPLGPLHQRITHTLYSAPSFVAFFAKFVLYSEACHLERDIMIWNSKRFLQRPLLVAEDKLIRRFRLWYQQFYSENSPTVQSEADKGLDW